LSLPPCPSSLPSVLPSPLLFSPLLPSTHVQVLEEIQSLEQMIAQSDAHDSHAAARRVAHLAHLLHSNT
jgi:hypothetical protein